MSIGAYWFFRVWWIKGLHWLGLNAPTASCMSMPAIYATTITFHKTQPENQFTIFLQQVYRVPSVLWRCWLGGRNCIRPVKNRVVGWWRGYLSGARCRLACGPADATATDHGRPQEGVRGVTWPPWISTNFSHIITVAPRVEIQMHFWKGAKFAGTVGHPMTKMLSASGGLRPPNPWTGALPLYPRYRLVLHTRHGAPPTTDPFRRLWPYRQSFSKQRYGDVTY